MYVDKARHVYILYKKTLPKWSAPRRCVSHMWFEINDFVPIIIVGYS